MKTTMKILWAFVLALPIIAVSVPTNAFVDVTALIFKDKDILETEDIHITKTVTITVTNVATYHGAAEAQAIANQLNAGNKVDSHLLDPDHAIWESVDGCKECIPFTKQPDVFGIVRTASILSSINGNDGVVGVNQDVGNMVNQANIVAVALSNSDTSLTNSQAEGDQINIGNFVRHNENLKPILTPGGNPTGTFTPDITATIDSSINTNTGVAQVNQNAGNMNNQFNSLALAIGLGSKFALSEAALGQVNAGNTVREVETVKFDLITGSVTGNSGVTSVNQSVGNMNNQANGVSLAVLTSKLNIVTPGATTTGP